jgi:hypothetical protein
MFRKRVSAAHLRGVALLVIVGSVSSFALGHALGNALGHRADTPVHGAATVRLEQSAGALGNALAGGEASHKQAAVRAGSLPDSQADTPHNEHDGDQHGEHKHGRSRGDNGSQSQGNGGD